MSGNIRIDDKSIRIKGRFKHYDVFEGKYSYPKNLIYGFTEIPEQFTSLLPIIDFIVDDLYLENYISFMEKIVIDDLYRIPPMTFAVVGFFNAYDDIKNLFMNRDYISFSTTQWYGWKTKISLKEENIIVDYIYSSSRYSPSEYRPKLINEKFHVTPKLIDYLNAPAFGGWLIIKSHEYIRDVHKPLLLPPNFFDSDGDSRFFRLLLRRKTCIDEYIREPASNIPIYIENNFRKFSRSVEAEKIILPMINILGRRLSMYYLILQDGVISMDDSDIYEDNYFVIDPFNEYRGSKLKIYFSLWNIRDLRKGFSMKINLNFKDYLLSYSRMFYEIRYGGKLLYSSSSDINIV